MLEAEGLDTPSQQRIPRRTDDGFIPLSFAQQRLWFFDQLEPGSSAYNIAAAIRLDGSLSLIALEQSLNAIVRRHEVMRTTFAAAKGQPIQVIAPELTLDLPLIDLTALPGQTRESEAQRLMHEEAQKPFDLHRGPLLRAAVLRLADQEHILLLTMHHIISDGWSTGVLVREIAQLYAAYVAGEPNPEQTRLPELPIQYADYAIWQRQWLQGEALDKELGYWTKRLGGALPVLELPGDYPRPAVQTLNGTRQPFELPAALSEKIRELSRQEDATLFMTLLAAFKTLLYRYTHQTDLLVGSPIANRTRAEIQGLIGFFANMLVLRSDLSGNPTFRDLLRQVREVSLEAHAHQDLPFEKLVEVLQPERDLSHNPLFQVAFALESAPISNTRMAGLTLTQLETDSGTSRFDLTLFVTDEGDKLSGAVEYNTDLFAPATIARLLGHYQALLEVIVADPNERIAYLPLLTEAERQQMLVDWNRSEAEYPRDAAVHTLIEAQAARTPDVPAIVFAGTALTYAELNTRANQLAHYLRAQGVGPDVLVALCVERSLEMIVGMLAILKAGGAYVPLDPAYPQERLAYMLSHTRAPVILTQAALVARLPEHQAQVFCLDADWPLLADQPTSNPVRIVDGDHLAYIIFTSGSTGRPKGVMVTQRGLINLVFGLRAYFNDPAVQTTGLITSISFDISVNQIFPTLIFGRTLHIIPDAVKFNSRTLLRYLHEQQVHLLDAVPSYMQAVLNEVAPEQPPNALRYLLIGGEKLEQRLLQAVFGQLGPAVEIVNIYGLTEISDINALGVLRASDLGKPITVGTPLQNNRIYILDQHNQPQPIGIAGEVCVAGASVSRGYLFRPELTAERFVACPFEDGQLMVRTGDLGRWQPDGTIEILGRIDHQVKIRGFRIEIGEIEAVLCQHEAVHEAVVTLREDTPGEKRLVAYIEPRTVALRAHQEPSAERDDSDARRSVLGPAELRQLLGKQLPDYMVPSAFVFLDTLPKTPNGKIDRKALPAPELAAELDECFVAPSNPIEELLASVWADVLGVERVGTRDNFFELGGHSLLATQIASRVREAFQVELPVRGLFEAPTVAELAERIAALKGSLPSVQAPPIQPVEWDGPLPLSFAQQRLWLLDQFEPNTATYNIPAAVRLRGSLDLAALERTLTEIVRRQASLRTTFTQVAGQPVQVIAATPIVPLPVIDLRSLPDALREDEARRLTDEEALRPFDLQYGPLCRFTVLRIADDDHMLLVTMHHIVSDGWSISVFVRELSALYT
ncbi:MAG TPA: amino acid adenylation domain-containing protein, partial [Herpetosiphonaceae bacterium]